MAVPQKESWPCPAVDIIQVEIMLYLALADMVVLVHALFVLFVVLGGSRSRSSLTFFFGVIVITRLRYYSTARFQRIPDLPPRN